MVEDFGWLSTVQEAMLHVDVDHHGNQLLYVDHHEVMYGRWIYYHIMEININAQFQPTC